MIDEILVGDVRDRLKEIPTGAVQCVITSPPYWGLRDYGVPGQIGLEETPEEYVQGMIEIFQEIRRVLRDDGTAWLNLGDCYNGSGESGGKGKNTRHKGESIKPDRRTGWGGLKQKDLVGIPWRVAFALQVDGWFLRQDIIWHKPNTMPESVKDRCTKAHEYIFLLTKQGRYFFDGEAIREPYAEDSLARVGRGRSKSHKWADGGPGRPGTQAAWRSVVGNRKIRDSVTVQSSRPEPLRNRFTSHGLTPGFRDHRRLPGSYQTQGHRRRSFES